MKILSFKEQEQILRERRKDIVFDIKEFSLDFLEKNFRDLPKNIWYKKEESVFIESIILRMPIQPFYFFIDLDNSLKTVDSIQKISAISRFLNDDFELTGLVKLKEFNGLKFSDLGSSLQRDIRNSTIRSIVFQFKV